MNISVVADKYPMGSYFKAPASCLESSFDFCATGKSDGKTRKLANNAIIFVLLAHLF